MEKQNKVLNLVLGGGGVKGIAYIGVLDEAEYRKEQFINIAGVSAGALVGSYIAAGYDAKQLKDILGSFNFGQMKVDEITKKVPAVSRFIEFQKRYYRYSQLGVEQFLNQPMRSSQRYERDCASRLMMQRGNLLKNVTTLSKEGCLFDGDFVEEWVFKVLGQKGIRTFADLRGGLVDKLNPRGYKVRMTTVDTNRGKVVILPDDIAFYGIDPDKLEVAKAVRMSTSVPFAFKPVEIKKIKGKEVKTYHMVDGGVFDNFPFWLVDASETIKTIGFRMMNKKKILSLDTPLNILKALVSKVHDLGIPKGHTLHHQFVGEIDTSNISFLDFDLGEDQKEFLYSSGKDCATKLFDKMEKIRFLG